MNSLKSKVDTNEGLLRTKFAMDGTVFSSVSDFNMEGSSFGVIYPSNLTLYPGFSIPVYSRVCFINYHTSSDGAIIAIASDGSLYTAFRNGGNWVGGRIL